MPISKRVFDLFFSLLGLILTFPFFLFLIPLVRLYFGKSVIFTQLRPGFRGKPFIIYKIRTMREAYDSYGQPLPDHQRLTRFGRWLRASSLDEWPELFNVLRGEMSLVGPRPLLMQYLERYSPEQARRHEVLPGITGWAQVNGRNVLNWEDKFSLDVWYVDNWSLILDMKILLITSWKVITREGINQPGYSTAEEFMGNQETE